MNISNLESSQTDQTKQESSSTKLRPYLILMQIQSMMIFLYAIFECLVKENDKLDLKIKSNLVFSFIIFFIATSLTIARCYLEDEKYLKIYKILKPYILLVFVLLFEEFIFQYLWTFQHTLVFPIHIYQLKMNGIKNKTQFMIFLFIFGVYNLLRIFIVDNVQNKQQIVLKIQFLLFIFFIIESGYRKFLIKEQNLDNQVRKTLLNQQQVIINQAENQHGQQINNNQAQSDLNNNNNNNNNNNKNQLLQNEYFQENVPYGVAVVNSSGILIATNKKIYKILEMNEESQFFQQLEQIFKKHRYKRQFYQNVKQILLNSFKFNSDYERGNSRFNINNSFGNSPQNNEQSKKIENSIDILHPEQHKFIKNNKRSSLDMIEESRNDQLKIKNFHYKRLFQLFKRFNEDSQIVNYGERKKIFYHYVEIKNNSLEVSIQFKKNKIQNTKSKHYTSYVAYIIARRYNLDVDQKKYILENSLQNFNMFLNNNFKSLIVNNNNILEQVKLNVQRLQDQNKNLGQQTDDSIEKSIALLANQNFIFANFIDILNDYNQIQKNEFQPEYSNFNLFDIIQDAISILSYQCSAKNTEITIEKNKFQKNKKIIEIYNDKSRIKQILIILLLDLIESHQFTLKKNKISLQIIDIDEKMIEIKIQSQQPYQNNSDNIQIRNQKLTQFCFLCCTLVINSLLKKQILNVESDLSGVNNLYFILSKNARLTDSEINLEFSNSDESPPKRDIADEIIDKKKKLQNSNDVVGSFLKFELKNQQIQIQVDIQKVFWKIDKNLIIDQFKNCFPNSDLLIKQKEQFKIFYFLVSNKFKIENQLYQLALNVHQKMSQKSQIKNINILCVRGLVDYNNFLELLKTDIILLNVDEYNKIIDFLEVIIETFTQVNIIIPMIIILDNNNFQLQSNQKLALIKQFNHIYFTQNDDKQFFKGILGSYYQQEK